MNYDQLFADVATWVKQANQEAMQHGIETESFWAWVTSSASGMCRKYNDHPLVIKQMMMLAEWLEEAVEKKKG